MCSLNSWNSTFDPLLFMSKNCLKRYQLLEGDLVRNIKLTMQNRVGIALAIIWSVVATLFYVSSLGFHEAGNSFYENLPEPLAFWAVICGKLNLYIFDIQVGEGKWSEGFFTAPTTLAFDPLGFAVFIIAPIVAWFALLSLLHWVKNGASKGQHS